jgi:hypothetical protein
MRRAGGGLSPRRSPFGICGVVLCLDAAAGRAARVTGLAKGPAEERGRECRLNTGLRSSAGC